MNGVEILSELINIRYPHNDRTDIGIFHTPGNGQLAPDHLFASVSRSKVAVWEFTPLRRIVTVYVSFPLTHLRFWIVAIIPLVIIIQYKILMFTINSNMIYNQIVLIFIYRYISILTRAIQNMLQLCCN